MNNYYSSSTADTERIGRELGNALKENTIHQLFIALCGEMGVGKTAFTRGFAAALGYGAVRSPTYTIVNEYKTASGNLFHFDFYRLHDEDDLYSIGYEDYLRRGGIFLCEWVEKVPDIIPPDAVVVSISRTDENGEGRLISIEIPPTIPLKLHQ